MKVNIWLSVSSILLLGTIRILGRDLSENERNSRALFVQRLLRKNMINEGRVKLLGGANRYEGNLYIYHAGRWGAVCDDFWDDAAANVICGAFNKTGLAIRGSLFGAATEKFWMDHVICEGDESTITQCKFSAWGSSDCDVTKAAGVICMNRTRVLSSKSKALGLRLHEVLDVTNARVKLAGGRDRTEGRVEILYEGVWGSVCPDGWTLTEASTVCHHLGLGFARQALQTPVFGASRITLSGVRCEGNETSLFHCRHGMLGQVFCAGDKGHVAAVVCTNKLADLALDVQTIERTAHLQDVPMFQLQCAMEENCLTRSAYEMQSTNPDWQFETRRLLRFTATSVNIGNDDFRPYLPKHLWQWHLCHMHYHSMEVFATFDVLNQSGVRIAEGHKASFCLEDNTCLPGVERKYFCKNYGDQGISVNCSDVYQYNLDCQWVDVTDVSPGDYTFKVAVNPHMRIPEQQYHNNAAECKLKLTESYASVYGCVLKRP